MSFICQVHGCSRAFMSWAGLTQHMHAMHPTWIDVPLLEDNDSDDSSDTSSVASDKESVLGSSPSAKSSQVYSINKDDPDNNLPLLSDLLVEDYGDNGDVSSCTSSPTGIGYQSPGRHDECDGDDSSGAERYENNSNSANNDHGFNPFARFESPEVGDNLEYWSPLFPDDALSDCDLVEEASGDEAVELPDSEEEVDATLDQSSESSSDSLFDCSGLPHLYDWEEHVDRHRRPGLSTYSECDEFPCLHRYDQPGNPSGRSWAEYPDESQESVLYPLPPESVFDLFSSPTPVVVSHSPSPQAPLQFVPATPSISLDFSDDFRDSPQFLLFTMGDIKPDMIRLLTSASQYSNWVAKIKGVMLFTGCWGPVLNASPPEGEKAEDWKKKDDQAKGLIWMHTATNYHYLLETKEEEIVMNSEPRRLGARL
ncbi:hypothetical protein BN946_scf184946.g9 [Trametes cinnabarina]|uniref:C2H2-type domain-containing protein n=1 Tax=Pycnoporus cinnabarinus TaxID=5643 RepID=A0A060STZ3_PYCCI|nr:hypothetical protein BN946_scf184946.g9 [Trametes cinnabarina]